MLLFALQGDANTSAPGDVARIALPLLAGFVVMFGGSFVLGRVIGLDHARTTTLSFTAAGNNVELAIAVAIGTAATRAGTSLNDQSVASLAEVGVDISTARTHQLTEDDVRAADLVVLGGEARVDPVDGTPVEVWETDEPSARGIEGMERVRLVRDDIAVRVSELVDRLG